MSKQSKTAAQNQAQGLGLQVLEDEAVWIGVDVHAASYQVAVWSARRQDWISEWVQPADDGALLRRLEPIRARIERVTYEAGPCGFGLARRLLGAGLAAQVIAPSHTPKAGVEQAKCDRLDARKLAHYSSLARMLRPVFIPSEQEEQDRQLFRVREGQKRRLSRVKQRIKALLLYHGLAAPKGLKHWSAEAVATLAGLALERSLRGALDELLCELAEARAAVMRCNRRLLELARSARYKELVNRLRTVPGVGVIVALAVILELPRPERFASRRQLTRLVGLCPEVASSGSSCYEELGRAPAGQATLRSLLVEAAWRWWARDGYARMLFGRYLRNTASKLKAIVALARKLLVILWRMRLNGLPYCPGLMRVPKTVSGVQG